MTELPLLPDLVVEPFNRADLRLLFPLMRMAEPDIDLPRWMAYASKLFRRRDGKAGILVARRHVRRFPCGAVCYRQAEDLRYGSVLLAEHFVAIDPIDPHSVLRALTQHLDQLAQELGCGAVRVIAPDGRASVELRRSGHSGEGVVLLKAFPPEAAEAGSQDADLSRQ
jgi:hypothetical protein